MSQELREQYARIIDPMAWGELGHDSYLERADEWFAKGRTNPGDPLTDGYRQKAHDMVQPSLAKADAILATRSQASTIAEVDRLRAISVQRAIDIVKSQQRGWFCSGDDCTEYDNGRDEGFRLAVVALGLLDPFGPEIVAVLAASSTSGLTDDGEDRKTLPQWFVEGLSKLDGPDQGLSYRAQSYGKRQYDTDTGEPYLSRSRPSELNVYGARADFLHRLICEAEKVRAALAQPDAVTSGMPDRHNPA